MIVEILKETVIMTQQCNTHQIKYYEVVISPNAQGKQINLNEIIQKVYEKEPNLIPRLMFEDGVYEPAEAIVIDKSLELIAKNTGKVTIKNDNLITLLIFSGDGELILSGIHFENGYTETFTNAIEIQSGHLEMSACKSSLTLMGGASARVINSEFSNSTIGFHLKDNAKGEIINCVFKENLQGLAIQDEASVVSKSNIYKQNQDSGIGVHHSASLQSMKDIAYNNLVGFGLVNDASVTIEEAKSYENQIYGFYANFKSKVALKSCKTYLNATSGIAVFGDSQFDIQECDFFDNDSCGLEMGDTSKCRLVNSKLYRNFFGIKLNDSSKAQVISNEIFENKCAIGVTDEGQVHIDQCKIYDNEHYLCSDTIGSITEGDNDLFNNDWEVEDDEHGDEGEESDSLIDFMAFGFGSDGSVTCLSDEYSYSKIIIDNPVLFEVLKKYDELGTFDEERNFSIGKFEEQQEFPDLTDEDRPMCPAFAFGEPYENFGWWGNVPSNLNEVVEFILTGIEEDETINDAGLFEELKTELKKRHEDILASYKRVIWKRESESNESGEFDGINRTFEHFLYIPVKGEEYHLFREAILSNMEDVEVGTILRDYHTLNGEVMEDVWFKRGDKNKTKTETD